MNLLNRNLILAMRGLGRRHEAVTPGVMGGTLRCDPRLGNWNTVPGIGQKCYNLAIRDPYMKNTSSSLVVLAVTSSASGEMSGVCR